MPDREAPAPLDERERVALYLTREYLRLGFNLAQATALVDAGADHHDVARLVRGGCPLELAARIRS